MVRTRVIPVLLLKGNGLVKTTRFDKPRYIGDPINAVKIFNAKEANELVFLDIQASKQGYKPNFELIKNIATECFMPLGYGGGINSLDDIARLFTLGVEKIIINTACLTALELVSKASEIYGSQSIVLCIDVQKNFWGAYHVYSHAKIQHQRSDLISYLQEAQAAGVGEIIINSVDRDGTMQGYDTNLIKKVASVINVPLVACGGAGSLSEFPAAIAAGASAVAAGSLFIYHGPHKAVLINYPSQKQLKTILP